LTRLDRGVEEKNNTETRSWAAMFWEPPRAGGPALSLVPLSGTKTDFNVEKWWPKRANRQD